MTSSGNQKPELQVICPVYREEDNIFPLWKELSEGVPQTFSLNFVYDFDEDPTLEPISQLIDANPERVSVTKNRGKGVLGALKTGFDDAQNDLPILVIMADLSDDLRIVPRMIQNWKDGAKVVVASRYMPGGKQIGGTPLKNFLSRVAGKSLFWFGRMPVRDATNNFRMYDPGFVKKTEIESQGGFEVALELTWKAVRSGQKVVEIPTVWRDRTAGESKFRLWKWLPHYLKWYFQALFPFGPKPAR